MPAPARLARHALTAALLAATTLLGGCYVPYAPGYYGYPAYYAPRVYAPAPVVIVGGGYRGYYR